MTPDGELVATPDGEPVANSRVPSSPVPRLGGRILFIDDHERLLLIHERIEDGSTHWLTPGGGVEPGELPVQAAVREALEETGIAVELAVDAAPVLVTRRLWSWAGIAYDQVDHFFAVRVSGDVAVEPAQLTDVERQTLLGYRWWTLDQLRQTTDVLLPPDVADVVQAVVGRPVDA